jgi:hypothetical protein
MAFIGGRKPESKGPPACPEWARTFFFTGNAPPEDSPDQAAFVTARFFPSEGTPTLEDLWVTHRAALLREWVRTRPGTRPPQWWRNEAPECRRFMPGQGIDANYYARGAYFIDVGVACPFPEDGGLVWEGEAKVESQPAFLRRLQLFLPGEQGRVKRAAFRPEVFDFRIPSEESGIVPGGPRADAVTAYARAVLKDGGVPEEDDEEAPPLGGDEAA